MNLSSIALVGFYALAFVAGTAGLVGYFRANVAKATILLYKEDNFALRGRVETLESQAKVAVLQHAEDQAKIKALEEAHQNLIQIVTQAEAIKALRAEVEEIGRVTERIAEKVGA